jgi:hypothetical protein
MGIMGIIAVVIIMVVTIPIIMGKIGIVPITVGVSKIPIGVVIGGQSPKINSPAITVIIAQMIPVRVRTPIRSGVPEGIAEPKRIGGKI